MIRVVLTSGKVLVYNHAERVSISKSESTYWIGYQDDDEHCAAGIPVARVERIDFEKPCKILRETGLRNRKVTR